MIATPQMPDPRFRETVIYICAHTDEGAMGLVINQPIPHLDLTDILRGADIESNCSMLAPVYIGGPIEVETSFVLYSADYKAHKFIEITDTVNLTRDVGILHDISVGRGPYRYLFVMGYSGWSAGQLESELKVNGWLTVPAQDIILFDTPDDLKWNRAAMEYGIDINLFGDVIGNA